MPCLMMAPIIEGVAEKHSEVGFYKINSDEAQDLSKEHKVSSIPCSIIFKDGKEIDRITGSVGEEVLEEKLSSVK